MQATTCFHDGVPNPILQEADFVFHASLAFHSTHGMFSPDAERRDPTIGRFFRWSEFPSTRCFLRLETRDAIQEESLEALILIQATAGWQRIACQLGHARSRRFPFTGVAQEAHVTGVIAHEEVFARVTLLLATVILVLLLRGFRPLDWSFGPLMKKRREEEGASLGGVVSLAAKSSAVRAGSRSWSARARFNTGGRRGSPLFACDWDIPKSCPCPSWMGFCFQEVRMKSRLSAIVGRGQVSYIL
jgi:hypothetical protein